MSTQIKIGRFFYGIGIFAYGIQQIFIGDFRPQILPGFPAWIHEYGVFAISSGAIMVMIGILISGLIDVKEYRKKNICIWLGFYFLTLIIVSHIPYLLFVYPHKLSHLGSWGDVLKELAFSGGAFILATTFTNATLDSTKKVPKHENLLMIIGRIFFCTTIILFGCNHLVYDISMMVPKWLGMQTFWSFFAGIALIASGVLIMFKIYSKTVALLLALMLFIWFLILHLPSAFADPYSGHGNKIVSAFDALLFCGIALAIAKTKNNSSPDFLKSDKI